MKSINIDYNRFELIATEIHKFKQRTHELYHVTFDDVLYSFIYSDERLAVLTDWNEGENNDPFWDKENNRHCCESFLVQMKEMLNKIES